MPRKKKPFIDKKKSIKFVVMPRGSSDMMASDPDAPRNVLYPLQPLQHNPLEDDYDSGDEFDEKAVEEDVRGRGRSQTRRPGYGEEDEVDPAIVAATLSRELRFGPDDDYDYSQHLKAIDEPGDASRTFSISIGTGGKFDVSQLVTPHAYKLNPTRVRQHSEERSSLPPAQDDRIRIDRKSLREASRSRSRASKAGSVASVAEQSQAIGARLGLAPNLFAQPSAVADEEEFYHQRFGHLLITPEDEKDLTELEQVMDEMEAKDTAKPASSATATKPNPREALQLASDEDVGVEFVGGELEEFDGGLPDNFIELANKSDTDDENAEKYQDEYDDDEDEETELDEFEELRKKTAPPSRKPAPVKQAPKPARSLDDIDGDDDDVDDMEDEEEDKPKRVDKAQPAPRVSEYSAELLEKFEKELADFEDSKNTLEDPLDPRLLAGTKDISLFENVMDEFLEKQAKSRVRYVTPAEERGISSASTATKPSKDSSDDEASGAVDAQEQDENDDVGSNSGTETEESDDMEWIYVKKRDPYEKKWDVESILSTLSNTDNLPKLIEEPPKPLKPVQLKLNKRGIPLAGLPASQAKSSVQEAEETAPPKPKIVISQRNKDETKEEKRLRKQAVKQARKESRARKKELKLAYKHEQHRQATASTKQATAAGGATGVSIFNF